MGWSRDLVFLCFLKVAMPIDNADIILKYLRGWFHTFTSQMNSLHDGGANSELGAHRRNGLLPDAAEAV